jgi:hypothetical protein
LGYSSDHRKVQKFENPAIFWRPASGTYLLCVCKNWQSQGGAQKTQLSLRNLATLVASFSQKNAFGWMSYTSFFWVTKCSTHKAILVLVFCICLHPIPAMVSILVTRTRTKLVWPEAIPTYPDSIYLGPNIVTAARRH